MANSLQILLLGKSQFKVAEVFYIKFAEASALQAAGIVEEKWYHQTRDYDPLLGLLLRNKLIGGQLPHT